MKYYLKLYKKFGRTWRIEKKFAFIPTRNSRSPHTMFWLQYYFKCTHLSDLYHPQKSLNEISVYRFAEGEDYNNFLKMMSRSHDKL